MGCHVRFLRIRRASARAECQLLHANLLFTTGSGLASAQYSIGNQDGVETLRALVSGFPAAFRRMCVSHEG